MTTGKAAVKQGDRIVATDMHLVLPPDGSAPLSLPHPFSGPITGNVSATVFINGRSAATVGSTAVNTPPHTPAPPGIAFQTPPTNTGTIVTGSRTVFINGRPAARQSDKVQTCADPVPNTNGRIVVTGSNVFIGE